LQSSPVVVLGGARQTGKSTLARLDAVGKARRYLTLDEIDVLERATRAHCGTRATRRPTSSATFAT